MKFVFYLIIIYLAYQFIFKLVIPVYRTTSKIKKGFKEMNEKMQQQQASANGTAQQNPQVNKAKVKPNPNDYIEFEEVK